MKVFIVTGICSDMDDTGETWLVAIYADPELAEQHKKMAIQRALEIYQEIGGVSGLEAWVVTRVPGNEWDKNMRMTRFGNDYSIEESVFYEHPDQYISHHGDAP